MSAPVAEIIGVFILILANACLALSEISIISSRRAKLRSMAESGSKSAAIALHLAENSSDMLSALQIGITLIGIMAGAVGGATISDDLELVLATVPVLAPYAKALSIGLVVSVITLLSLILGELVPKRIGLSDPEKFACMVAPGVKFLCTITAPGVRLLTMSTRAVSEGLGVQESVEKPISQDELRILMDEGAKAGVFEQSEKKIFNEALRLADRTVKEIMTHRHKVVWINLNDELSQSLEKMRRSAHVWFPAGEGTLDEVVGVINAKDILAAALNNKDVNLRSFLRKPIVVPDKNSALDALNTFKQSRIHTAIVSDEYGGVQGILSLTDLLEAIVGEIPTLEDHTIFSFTKRNDGSLLLDGIAHISQVEELLGVSLVGHDKSGEYRTLAGFMLHHMENIPVQGQDLCFQGFKFEVVDMDHNRIDKVLITKDEQPNSN